MKPTNDEVDSTLDAIEQAEQVPAVWSDLSGNGCHAVWMSDAERLGLPVVNVTDSGARLLQADVVLGHGHHDRRLGKQ